VHKVNTSAYRPKSNGALERTHKTMTRYKPYEILFGRKANVPEELQQKPTAVYNYDDIVHDVKKRLQDCYELARANLIQTKQNMIAQQASKVNMHKFYAGDKVLLRKEKAGKLDPLWKGPYVIVEVDSDKPNVIIELNKKKRIEVHVNRLKRYHSK
jgi:hypothetical protein